MSGELEVSEMYVRCQGRDHVEILTGADGVAVVDDGTLPREWERGENPYKGHWVAVPWWHVERRYERMCSAVWDGQRVGVIGLDAPLVQVAWEGPELWGRAHDLQGSQYEGWTGWAPIDELTDVRVDESEYPVRRASRRSHDE